MRIITFIVSYLFLCLSVKSQSLSNISISNVSRIEKIISDDSMAGRKVFTEGIEKAASFIVEEFKSAGLKPMQGNNGFRQTFSSIEPISTEFSGNLDGLAINKEKIFALTVESSFTITEKDHYERIFVRKGENFLNEFVNLIHSANNAIVIIDTSFSSSFSKMARRKFPQLTGSGNRIFILSNEEPKNFQIHVEQKQTGKMMSNLVGFLPGKTKPNEYVIFSAHYDHLGTKTPDQAGDSVYNGANDDASGTTAVIELAKYFGQLKDNQRSILFTAFTAEEVGEFGSTFFATTIDPGKIAAMLNIEMIGTESKWGMNSAYLTGYDKSSLGQILSRSLSGSKYSIKPDPYPDQNLFLRSDNASLAMLGVPAHTISTSKMDAEPYYHQRGDEFKTLDMTNMTEIIRLIAMSMKTIINGLDTPTRVKSE